MNEIKIVFVSNYMNHHQLPISTQILLDESVDYYFIQTEKMEAERVKMGWAVDVTKLRFVKCYYDDPSGCKKLIMDADVVIFGGTDEEKYIQERLASGKIVIRYSERIYKDGQWKFISPKGLIKKYHDHIRYAKKPVYMLCSGAYVASDFSLIHAYKDKMFTWGYFPEVKEYSECFLMDKKEKESSEPVRFLWTGRMIKWKHPEEAIAVANALKKAGKNFKLTMIGSGPIKESLRNEILEKKLSKYVELIDFVEPSKVREYMLQSDVYLFTSDYKEGWGAVLNESLNSGCAVIASSGIGAVPYLVKHGVNGMVYKTGKTKELVKYALELCDDKGLRIRLGMAGYNTMRDKWNPKCAAERLIRLIRALLKDSVETFSDDGPLSKAEIIAPKKGYAYCRNNHEIEK